MRQTIFYIPHELLGLTVLGWGWMLAIWLLVSVGVVLWLWRRHGWDADTRGSVPVVLVVAAVIIFVLPQLEARSPTGVPLGLPIRGYGVMLLAGILSGVALAVRQGRRAGFDADTIYAVSFWMFFCGIVGARVFYVVQYWPTFHKETARATVIEILKFTEGGLVVYGSLIGGVLAFTVFARLRRLPALRLADVLAPAMVLGLALGRVGCLCNGCCFGGEAANFPLAIRFPRYTCPQQEILSPPYAHQLATGRLHGFRVGAQGGIPRVAAVDPGGPAAAAGLSAGLEIRAINGTPVSSLPDVHRRLALTRPEISITTSDGRQYRWTIRAFPPYSLPVHPTQLYGAVNGGVLCLFLLAFYPFRPRDGAVFAALLTVYPVTRFLLEVIRDDESGKFGSQLTISQLTSIVSLVLVAGFWAYLARQGTPSQDVPAPH